MKKSPSILTVTLNPSFDVTLWLADLSESVVNRITNETKEAAGTGVNIALALRGLGNNVRAVGIAGDENLPPFIEHLRMNGISANFVPVPGAIRENITLRVDDRTIKINRKGPICNQEDITNLKRIISRLTISGDIIVFGGSIPQGMESSDYCELIEYASNLNLRVAVDSDVLSAEQLEKIRPWMAKPNEFELEMITGKKLETFEDVLREAKGLCENGIENVIVSMGEHGLLAVCESSVVRAEVPKISVKSTVGAGDSTLAGFISAYLNDFDFKECARYAAACGTAAATFDGTGIISKESAEKYVDKITVNVIE